MLACDENEMLAAAGNVSRELSSMRVPSERAMADALDGMAAR
jgi:hypothetical protein